MSLVLIILSSLFYLIGIIPYLYHVFHGRVVPHPFTWTIWSIFAITNGYILSHEQWITETLIPIGVRSLALCIWACLWWYFIRKIRIWVLDFVALFFAITIIVLMKIIGNNETVWLMILIDLLVLTPTLKKLWINPDSEDPLAWFMAAVSQLILIYTIQNFTFTSLGYILYLVLVNFSVAFIIYRRRIYTSSWKYFLRKMLPSFALKKKLW